METLLTCLECFICSLTLSVIQVRNNFRETLQRLTCYWEAAILPLRSMGYSFLLKKTETLHFFRLNLKLSTPQALQTSFESCLTTSANQKTTKCHFSEYGYRLPVSLFSSENFNYTFLVTGLFVRLISKRR